MASGGASTTGTSASPVDLGRLAERDPLALEIRRRVTAHSPGTLGYAALIRMWGTVIIVRRDAAHGSIGLRELTLRFDYGRLVIHDGRVGRPDISLWGTDEEVLSLGDVVRRGRASVGDVPAPLRWWTVGRAISRVSSDEGQGGHLQIFGGMSHPRLLYRLALVLATQTRSEAPAAPP